MEVSLLRTPGVQGHLVCQQFSAGALKSLGSFWLSYWSGVLLLFEHARATVQSGILNKNCFTRQTSCWTFMKVEKTIYGYLSLDCNLVLHIKQILFCILIYLNFPGSQLHKSKSSPGWATDWDPVQKKKKEKNSNCFFFNFPKSCLPVSEKSWLTAVSHGIWVAKTTQLYQYACGAVIFKVILCIGTSI